jgi:hypothetical protein
MVITMPPKWFNQHGLKMILGEREDSICAVIHEAEVVICSRVAKLQIRPCIKTWIYQVLWHITFSPNEFVRGEIRMHSSELWDAFDLSKNPQSILASEPDTDAAVQGRYIRVGRFLNIPTLGSGVDGDPNISVYISDEIQDAVRKLLKTYE